MLPIEAVRDPVMAALEAGPVVVSSPTGSGKSTQVPRWCAKLGRVLVVEPRRVACRSLAVRVAQLEGARLGGRVGYSVRDDHRCAAGTQVVFATPGIVLRMLGGDGLDGFDTVIMDEFHERGLDTDLILALLRKRFAGRLLVMSATIEGERLAASLGGRHIHAEGRTFGVDKRHLPKGTLLPAVKGLESRVLAAVRAAQSDPGDILVFLPGKGEIAQSAAALHGTDLDVLPLHGGLSLKEQSRVFERGRRRRVILATNVAETSLTIDGIGVVIDSGLVRQTRYFGGRGFLMLVPIADDSAEQRAGRAGRTSEGVVYRLWDQAARLDPMTPPQMMRESLVPLVLAAAGCGEDVNALPFFDAPRDHAVQAATEELAALGALDKAAVITERGRRLFGLPLPSHLGRLLVEAQGGPLLGAVIDLVAALGVDRPLFARERPEDAEDDLRAQGCDAVALIRAVRDGDPRRHGLSRYALSEARAGRRRLRKAMGLGDRDDAATPSSRTLAALALAADPRCAHVRRERKRRTAWANGGTEIELGRDSAVDPETHPAIAVLDTRALGSGQRDTHIVATCAIPLSLRALADEGLGRDRLARVALEKGAAVAVIERVYARKVLATREEIPTGALAREAVRDLFLRGSIFKAARPETLERLALASLYHQLVMAGREEALYTVFEAAEPEQWVLARLAELGLESGDELGLLSDNDLLPPALPEALVAKLNREYPRSLSMGDAEYAIEYEFKRRMVTLTLVRGRRKDPPPANFLPPLRGLGIQVGARGKTRVIRTSR